LSSCARESRTGACESAWKADKCVS
jgi:hypothetical protein